MSCCVFCLPNYKNVKSTLSFTHPLFYTKYDPHPENQEKGCYFYIFFYFSVKERLGSEVRYYNDYIAEKKRRLTLRKPPVTLVKALTYPRVFQSAMNASIPLSVKG
jgi:hypothetical protein